MHIGFITPANARELNAKSHEAKRQKKMAAFAAAQESMVTKPDIVTTKEPSELTTLARQIKNQIDSTVFDYAKAREPRDKQALAMALDRLLGSWALLTGHPRPGVRRVTREAGRSSGPAFVPAETTDHTILPADPHI
jgi:hypothetical protein